MSYAWALSKSLHSPIGRAASGKLPKQFIISRSVLRTSCCRRGFQSSTRSLAGPTFTFKIAAAFSGKSNVFDQGKHHYTFDSSTGNAGYADPGLTSQGRKLPSGQDSFFVTSIGDSSAAAFAVADGVGGYKDSGIDSADFAHGITKYMKETAERQSGNQGTKDKLTPLRLLQEGYNRLCHDESIKGGGSTACVAVADPDGTLSVANLGDSGFVHLRLNEAQYYSNPQTHAFNTPFQLSTIPPKILAQIENYGGNLPFRDMPKDASLSSHDLQHGDVLCFGTDGVWDNLTAQDVRDRVSALMMENGAWAAREGKDMQASEVLPWLTKDAAESKVEGWVPLHTMLAIDITHKAKQASVDTKRDGPFAKAVQQAYPNERWHGGKIDDICVVVVIAIEDADISS